MRPFLPCLLAALAAAHATTAASAQDDWRDRGEGRPAAEWDALEGQLAPVLRPLDSWVNSPVLKWKDLRGQVVLLHHMNFAREDSWRGVDEWIPLFREYADQGFLLFSVHNKREADSFPKKALRRGWPQLLAADVNGKFGRKLSVSKVPTLHLVDRDGVIRVAGLRPEAAREAVEALLAEPWDGERGSFELTRRVWEGPLVTEKVVPPGPGGWPGREEKDLYARRDLRGKQSPPWGVTQWLNEPTSTEGVPHALIIWKSSNSGDALTRGQELEDRFGPSLTVLAVSEEGPLNFEHTPNKPYGPRVERYLAKRSGITVPIALDGEEVLINGVKLVAYPHALLVDSTGIVRWQGNPLSVEFPLSDRVVAQFLGTDRARFGDPYLLEYENGFYLVDGASTRPAVWGWRTSEAVGTVDSLALGGAVHPMQLARVGSNGTLGLDLLNDKHWGVRPFEIAVLRPTCAPGLSRIAKLH